MRVVPETLPRYTVQYRLNRNCVWMILFCINTNYAPPCSLTQIFLQGICVRGYEESLLVASFGPWFFMLLHLLDAV